MIHRSTKHSLLPLLALGLTLAAGASVPAQSRAATAVSFQINFGTSPQWVAVPNTQVYQIREGQRPNYDMFRYSNSYYAYNNNQWYRSNTQNGNYVVISAQAVPSQLHQVPSAYWRNYPSEWQQQNYQQPYQGGNRAPVNLYVNFNSRPQWMAIPYTRITVVSGAQRPAYDMFHYGHSYYIYTNHRWYVGRHWRGQFTIVDDRYVPSAFHSIPRNYWQAYPVAWQPHYYQNYQGASGPYGTLQVNFGTAPEWAQIPNSNVQGIPVGELSDYDVFRYDNSYYAYNNNRWYSSTRPSGQFNMIDAGQVPAEFHQVPSGYWRDYPSGWQATASQGPGGTYGSLQVSFGSAPQWVYVPNTQVAQVSYAQRPDYDVFRYSGSYYAYNNNQWYSSSRETGQFAMIPQQSVPNEIRQVPASNWRNYPKGWSQGQGNGNNNGNRGNHGNNGNGNNGNGNNGNGNGGGN